MAGRPPPPSDIVELAPLPPPHPIVQLPTTARTRSDTDATLLPDSEKPRADEILAEEGLYRLEESTAEDDSERSRRGMGWASRWRGGRWSKGSRGSSLTSSGDGSTSSPPSGALPPVNVRLAPVSAYQARFDSLLSRLRIRHPRTGAVLLWLRGPSPAWIETSFPPFPLPYFGPFLARLERSLTSLLRPLERRREFITPVFLLAWLLGLAFLARASYWTSSTNLGTPTWIDSTTTYWLANDQCGLNGTYCEPFSDTNLTFRCPSQVLSTELLNQRTVGAESVIYEPLVVGGFDSLGTYRADSWVCAAAIQQGLFNDRRGGCGQLELVGEFSGYQGGERNGVRSIGFEGAFPSSYRFVQGVDQGGCRDLRDDILGFDVAMSVVFSALIRPAPKAFFWSLFCFGFWHISLASDPSAMPPDLESSFRNFLPALFVGESFWRHAWRWTLPAFEASGFVSIERTVWYLGGFWFGALENISLEWLPLDRLTPHEINQRPGGLIAVIVLAVFLFFAILNQLRVIRRDGWFFFYLKWYVVGGAVLGVLAALPGLELRLHHYIAGICLIPGTAFVTRPSAIFQGFLTGLFLQGASRWGMDSILQTPASLVGDGALGSSLPQFLTNSTNFAAAVAEGVISWVGVEQAGVGGEGWDGFALLVDDVLRQTGAATNFSLAGLDTSIVHYFRLAYRNGDSSGDFTKAATAFLFNSTWIDPKSGPS